MERVKRLQTITKAGAELICEWLSTPLGLMVRVYKQTTKQDGLSTLVQMLRISKLVFLGLTLQARLQQEGIW